MLRVWIPITYNYNNNIDRIWPKSFAVNGASQKTCIFHQSHRHLQILGPSPAFHAPAFLSSTNGPHIATTGNALISHRCSALRTHQLHDIRKLELKSADVSHRSTVGRSEQVTAPSQADNIIGKYCQRWPLIKHINFAPSARSSSRGESILCTCITRRSVWIYDGPT